MVTRQQVIVAARSYLGVRWKHQGRSRLGIDCLGLLIAVASDLGLSAHDSTDYPRIPDGFRLMRELNTHLRPVSECDVGDVLLMRFNTNPQHVAIKTDVGIIHSYANARKVVEHGLDATWSSRIVCAYQFPGITE